MNSLSNKIRIIFVKLMNCEKFSDAMQMENENIEWLAEIADNLSTAMYEEEVTPLLKTTKTNESNKQNLLTKAEQ